MAMTSLREARAFLNVLESAAGPHALSTLVEKWSDAARAAAAAARRTRSTQGAKGNWRKAAWQAYATTSGEAVVKGKGRAGSKGQGFDKWADRRADAKADNVGMSRRQATFADRHEAVFQNRKQGILDKMRGKNTAAARTGAAPHRNDGSFQKLIDAPLIAGNADGRKPAKFRRGSIARGTRRSYGSS
jgi:hypothetical protein